MFSFLKPQYIQEARMVWKNARKILAYKRDLLKAEEVARVQQLLDALDGAIHAGDQGGIEKNSTALEKLFTKYFPAKSDAGWRENCEVFLVAIVIAISVRTYFLQPFTIPTGSMQPTLNGIIGYSTSDQPAPNVFKQIFDFAILGRSYVDVVAKDEETVERIAEVKRFFFLNYTDIRCTHGEYLIHAPLDTLRTGFGVDIGRSYHTGEPIARGHIDTGDHVFVDKVSYNFRRPRGGEVFVFKTTGIVDIERNQRLRSAGTDEEIGSQFYIKRLAGLPGDELRIDPPNLYINGQLAAEPGFLRVMRSKDGYHGYSNGPSFRPGGFVADRPFTRLGSPEMTFRLPEKQYFALGDNSYHSSDSRDWGTVPQQNIMGRGFFVYWPFASHWGLIR